MPTHQNAEAPVRPSDETQHGARIKVVGIGGGGNNAIDRMIASGMEGVEFIALNTDIQALQASKAEVRGQIGSRLTNGLSAGSDPDVGRRAALQDSDLILEALDGADMVFVTAGLGGGTGTGAAPVIAALASEMGALTVAIVTRPFGFEGKRRMAIADWGIKHLLNYVDTLIVIPNEKLLAIAKDAPFFESFRIADDFLREAVQGISDIITTSGVINRDFADVKTTMAGMGYGVMGTASRSGPNRAVDAVMAAMASPLLEAGAIDGAQGILINISGSGSLRLSEVNDASTVIQSVAHDDANIIFGAVLDERLGDEVKVTVIATGFRDDGRDRSARRARLLREREEQTPQIASTPTPTPTPTPESSIVTVEPEDLLEVEQHVPPEVAPAVGAEVAPEVQTEAAPEVQAEVAPDVPLEKLVENHTSSLAMQEEEPHEKEPQEEKYEMAHTLEVTQYPAEVQIELAEELPHAIAESSIDEDLPSNEFHDEDDWREAIRALARLTEMDAESEAWLLNAPNDPSVPPAQDTRGKAELGLQTPGPPKEHRFEHFEEESPSETTSLAIAIHNDDLLEVQARPLVATSRQAAIAAYTSVSTSDDEPETQELSSTNAFAAVLEARRRFVESLAKTATPPGSEQETKALPERRIERDVIEDFDEDLDGDLHAEPQVSLQSHPEEYHAPPVAPSPAPELVDAVSDTTHAVSKAALLKTIRDARSKAVLAREQESSANLPRPLLDFQRRLQRDVTVDRTWDRNQEIVEPSIRVPTFASGPEEDRGTEEYDELDIPAFLRRGS